MIVLLLSAILATGAVLVGFGTAAANSGRAPTAAVVQPGTFSIAIIPDTQNEVFGQDNRFANRTEWLVNNRDPLNLAFVLHTGDVVNWDTPDHAQYAVASNALKRLDDAGIPWIPAIGNHDTAAVCSGGSACPGQSAHDNLRRTQTFNQYFPLNRFPAVGGAFEAGKVDNTYSTFTAGNQDWLVLNLELWPRSAAVSWARSVVERFSSHNVIIVTHSYLNGGGGIEQTNGGYGDTSPQYVYDNLVRPNSNVKFVFSGHVGDAATRKDVRPDGSTVVSFLGAFHSNSTNPVQILTVDTAAGSVSTRFLAPKDGTTWPQYAASVTGLSWASGPRPADSVVALRSMANNKIVAAESAGGAPLIANRDAVGSWERFTLQRLGGSEVALRASVNGRFVCADSGGAAPLVANRTAAQGWEQFELVNNSDGTVSLRSRANNLFVTAEHAGSQPLIANRSAIGAWEKFQLIAQ